ncbi:MAG TPA: Tol-Pal system beta propeller repeat protein TolB, partial [Roseiarcus sp.]|nr:Tol-Pal system beta propeller repeat protein TolB [Roseiarcus sp.]
MPFSLFVLRFSALAAFLLASLAAGPGPASAETGDVYVHAGANFKPVTIAVTPFVGEEGGDRIDGVVSNDFARSIFLLPVNPTSFPETISNPDVRPNIDAWKTIDAQFVLTGRVLRPDSRHVTAQFRLWDASTGEQVAGEQYTTEAANARRVAHMIADSVFSRVTGEKGFFDSRIVFVDETGPKDKRRKRLALMDMDGANVKTLGGGEGLVVTPRFSPSAPQVAYMSFGSAEPKVTLLNLETGQREAVGNFPGMTFAPRFSPDGQEIVMSLSDGASTNLYSMDLRSRATTRLTESSAIDTSPTYSPDGSQIAFESDRGGSQQIYVMSSSGGPAKRISFGEGRYSTPVWSPRGDLIAFTRIKGGSFGIGVMKPDGSGERILVEG